MDTSSLKKEYYNTIITKIIKNKEDFDKNYKPINKIITSNIPKSLYSYKSYTQSNIQLLEKDEIFHTTPINFNNENEIPIYINRERLEKHIDKVNHVTSSEEYFDLIKIPDDEEYNKYIDNMKLYFESNFKTNSILKVKSIKQLISEMILSISPDLEAINLKGEEAKEYISSTINTKFEEYVSIYHGTVKDHFLRKINTIVSNYLEEYPKSINDYNIDEAIKKTYSYLNETPKIACFSENPSSEKLWTQHADRHTGFVLEYDFNKCTEITEGNLQTILFPILYTEIYPDITNLVERYITLSYIRTRIQSKIINSIIPIDQLVLIKSNMCKSTSLEREQEWRTIILNNNIDNLIFKPSTIYLGKNMTKENKDVLIKLANEKEINIIENTSNYIVIR